MSGSADQQRRFSKSVAGFLAVQVLIASAACGAIRSQLWDAGGTSDFPAMRNRPLLIAPQYNYPWVVSDTDLLAVLHKLRPRLGRVKPKVNYVDHALRFWGTEAVFRDPECLCGQEMFSLLVDHRRFAEWWGAEEPPLLIREGDGVRVRTKDGNATSSHDDHTLAGLGEVGTPLDFPLHTPTGSSKMKAMLQRSLRVFSLNQVEYEWSALAYALYLQSPGTWRSSENQEITFDRIAERIMRQGLRQGVCYGNHRLHTLVVLLRADEQTPILSSQMRARIIAHLRRATALLMESQHPDGYWNGNWPDGAPQQDDSAEIPRDTLNDRLLATGHALEWWALAPEEVHPPREVLIRAGTWLSRQILALPEEKVTKGYTFLTHCGRALALWRGHFPAHFIPAMEQKHYQAVDAKERHRAQNGRDETSSVNSG